MAKTYLVQNHLYGNLYLTKTNPDIITQTCETCGDADYILAMFNDQKDSPDKIADTIVDAYADYFCFFPTEEDVLNDSYGHEELWKAWNDVLFSFSPDILSELGHLLEDTIVRDDIFFGEEEIAAMVALSDKYVKRYGYIKEALDVQV